MDIAEHLAKHAKSIDFVAGHHVNKYNNPDDFDEVKQAIMVLMWERHESGAYDHAKGFTLWAYVQPALKQTVFETLNDYRHFTDNTVVVPTHDVDEEGFNSLEDLEEMGRIAPINWYWSGSEEQPSTLTPEELKQAQKIAANLSDGELTILLASVGRSLHRAAEYLDMPYATYRRRLKLIRAKAQDLAQGLPGPRG